MRERTVSLKQQNYRAAPVSLRQSEFPLEGSADGPSHLGWQTKGADRSTTEGTFYKEQITGSDAALRSHAHGNFKLRSRSNAHIGLF